MESIHYIFLSMNPGHQPERFQVYEELPDSSGFTIPNCTHVFRFDRYGGWKDEYGNYYNQQGQAEDPPSDREEESQSDSKSAGDQSLPEEDDESESDDPFEAEFGRPGVYSDESEEQERGAKEEEVIVHNLLNLQAYPQEQLLRVYIKNLPYRTRKEELLKAYTTHASGILNAVIDYDEQGKGIGTGYFIVTPEVAKKVINLEGRRLLERPLYFQIESYENFMVFPVQERELASKQPPPKKFVPKDPEAKTEQPVVVREEPKWGWYKFEKALFYKISHFRNWMSDHGFNAEQDFRNIQKMDDDPEKRFVKVQLTETAFQGMKGAAIGEQKVQFMPL